MRGRVTIENTVKVKEEKEQEDSLPALGLPLGISEPHPHWSSKSEGEIKGTKSWHLNNFHPSLGPEVRAECLGNAGL